MPDTYPSPLPFRNNYEAAFGRQTNHPVPADPDGRDRTNHTWPVPAVLLSAAAPASQSLPIFS